LFGQVLRASPVVILAFPPGPTLLPVSPLIPILSVRAITKTFGPRQETKEIPVGGLIVMAFVDQPGVPPDGCPTGRGYAGAGRRHVLDDDFAASWRQLTQGAGWTFDKVEVWLAASLVQLLLEDSR
jgi:hypothetical protein